MLFTPLLAVGTHEHRSIIEPLRPIVARPAGKNMLCGVWCGYL